MEQSRNIQRERFKTEHGVHTHAAMTPRLIRRHCELDAEGAGFLEHAMDQMNLSSRANDRILMVSRTLDRAMWS